MDAPASLHLNISNSLAQGGESSNPVCQLSFYSPYWVDNRTNMDLLLQDHASAPPNPLLLGYKTPLDYSEVHSPGSIFISNNYTLKAEQACEPHPGSACS